MHFDAFEFEPANFNQVKSPPITAWLWHLHRISHKIHIRRCCMCEKRANDKVHESNKLCSEIQLPNHVDARECLHELNRARLILTMRRVRM